MHTFRIWIWTWRLEKGQHPNFRWTTTNLNSPFECFNRFFKKCESIISAHGEGVGWNLLRGLTAYMSGRRSCCERNTNYKYLARHAAARKTSKYWSRYPGCQGLWPPGSGVIAAISYRQYHLHCEHWNKQTRGHLTSDIQHLPTQNIMRPDGMRPAPIGNRWIRIKQDDYILNTGPFTVGTWVGVLASVQHCTCLVPAGPRTTRMGSYVILCGTLRDICTCAAGAVTFNCHGIFIYSQEFMATKN